MPKQRVRTDQPEQELLTSRSGAENAEACIVCGQHAGGKAICGDTRCAQELAQG